MLVLVGANLAGILGDAEADPEGLIRSEERGPLGQLSLLPSVGREMSTSQSAVMLCGWGVKAGMVHSTCG